MWKLDSVHMEILQILTQHRCMLCAERTTSSKTVLDGPDVTLGDLGHVDSRFGLFGDSVSVSARQVHGLRQTYHRLRIILDAPDGTP
jgi:hypothetical protein